jgi:integrase
MSLYQGKDGKWGVDYRDEWGRRYRKPVGSQEAAAAVAAQLAQDRARHKATLLNFQNGSALTLTEARDVYMANLTVADVTRSHMLQRFTLFERYLGQSQLSQVTPALLHKWLEHRRKMLSQQTLFRDVKMLRAWFAWLEKNCYIPANPAATLQLEKPTLTSARAISYEEERQLLSLLQPHTALRVLIAIDTGASLGEIARLRRNDIDFLERTLTVRHPTKHHKVRTVPLTPRLYQAFLAQCAKLAPDAPISSRSGQAVKVGNDFLKRARRSMPTRFRFHDLRHTFASRLNATGCPAFTLAHLQGHAVPRWYIDGQGRPALATTAAYVHPSLDELRAAIQKMDAARPKGETP